MDNERRTPFRKADYRAMSTAALEELLRRDLKENLLDVETICTVSKILKRRMEQESPEEIPPIDLEWKSFRENYISIKARFRRFLRRLVPLFLVILAVIAAAGLIYWYGIMPVASESLLDSISLEDGSFLYHELHADMGEAEIEEWLDKQDLLYTSADPMGAVPYNGGWYDVNDITWITVSGEIRIRELEKLPFHCTFFFKKGLLTHVDLESDTVRGDLTEPQQQFRMAIYALETKFGTALGNFVQTGPDSLGEKTAFWKGKGFSRLELIGRHERFLKQDQLYIVGVDEDNGFLIDTKNRQYDPEENPYEDKFTITIRVIFRN